MQLIGSKDSFGIGLGKDMETYQLAVYIQGNDILQFEKGGIKYTYRWQDCQDLVDWIQENIKYVLSNDRFPLAVSGKSSAEKCELSYRLDLDDIEQYEILQEWMFRHSWFSARAGSYLADIFFVRNENMIEISWDNTTTFREDGVKFVFPKGKYEVDIDIFKKVMEDTCTLYTNL